jgi:hypothetical protein
MKKQKMVSFIFELYDDSSFFLNEAKKLDEGDERQYRFIRASILSAWAGFEGWINETASDFETSVGGLSIHERGFLIEKRIELDKGTFCIAHADKYESIENKIEFLAMRFGKHRLDKSTKKWQEFKNVKGKRDCILHPKIKHDIDFSIEDAENTISVLTYYRNWLTRLLFK